MSGFVLIASYPKSGSTWLRAVIQSLRDDGAAVNINANPAGTTAAADRRLFDARMGVAAADLTHVEIAWARPQVWVLEIERPAPRPLIKIHDAYLPPLPGLEPAFPREAMGAIVYIVRDPRDVAVSFAHHFAVSIDDAIAWMANADAVLDASTERLPDQLPQFLSSWSRHVESWIDISGPRLHVARYEDMHADAHATFGAIAAFLELDVEPSTLDRAVSRTRFSVLRAQEDRDGFKEREPHMVRFFRGGTAGEWRNVLQPRQAERIVSDHAAVMRRFAYV